MTPSGGATRRPDDLEPFTLTLRLAPGQHAGLTLKNTPDRFGVLVEKVKSRDAAYLANSARFSDQFMRANPAP